VLVGRLVSCLDQLEIPPTDLSENVDLLIPLLPSDLNAPLMIMENMLEKIFFSVTEISFIISDLVNKWPESMTT
jgi:hypothetical protein